MPLQLRLLSFSISLISYSLFFLAFEQAASVVCESNSNFHDIPPIRWSWDPSQMTPRQLFRVLWLLHMCWTYYSIAYINAHISVVLAASFRKFQVWARKQREVFRHKIILNTEITNLVLFPETAQLILCDWLQYRTKLTVFEILMYRTILGKCMLLFLS